MPRKESADSTRITWPTSNAPRTSTGGSAPGRRWRRRMTAGRWPMPRAASTKSRPRSPRTSPRTRRLMSIQAVPPRISTSSAGPGRKSDDTASSRKSQGKARSASTARMRTASSQGPPVAADAPTAIPSVVASSTASSPIASDTRAPWSRRERTSREKRSEPRRKTRRSATPSELGFLTFAAGRCSTRPRRSTRSPSGVHSTRSASHQRPSSSWIAASAVPGGRRRPATGSSCSVGS